MSEELKREEISEAIHYYKHPNIGSRTNVYEHALLRLAQRYLDGEIAEVPREANTRPQAKEITAEEIARVIRSGMLAYLRFNGYAETIKYGLNDLKTANKLLSKYRVVER